jgi:hypothetical protein
MNTDACPAFAGLFLWFPGSRAVPVPRYDNLAALLGQLSRGVNRHATRTPPSLYAKYLARVNAMKREFLRYGAET